jgi:hypothetical protein
MAGAVHVPWYATAFRGDRFAEALSEISAVSLRYGATGYEIFRYREDRYKFIQSVEFEDKLAFARYWDGPEFIRFRTRYSGWYQVPVVYQWVDIVATGRMPENGGNGGNGEPQTAPVGGGSAGDTI